MIFEQIKVGNMQNFSYLFADSDTHEGLIIDPAFDAEKLLSAIGRHKIKLKNIILTHHHYDHINAAEAVKSKTDAIILCHAHTASLLNRQSTYDKLIDDKEIIRIGNCEIICIHTPGHSPGGICLIVDNRWLVSGDTLFIGDCGRADLEGGSIDELFRSLQKIKNLNENLIVCPGHDYGNARTGTLKEELKQNPALQAGNIEEFKKL